MRLRVEVEDHHGSTVLSVDSVLEELPSDMRIQLTEEVAQLIGRLGAPVDAEEVVSVLARQAAAEREARNRGVTSR